MWTDSEIELLPNVTLDCKVHETYSVASRLRCSGRVDVNLSRPMSKVLLERSSRTICKSIYPLLPKSHKQITQKKTVQRTNRGAEFSEILFSDLKIC